MSALRAKGATNRQIGTERRRRRASAAIGSAVATTVGITPGRKLLALSMRVDGYVHVSVRLLARLLVFICLFSQTEMFLMRFQTQIFLFEFLF